MAFDFNTLNSIEPGLEQTPTFLRRLGGANQSILVSDEAGDFWVLKLRSTLRPTNQLANEVLGSHLCGVLGLPVPNTKALRISSQFFEDQRTWLRTMREPIRPNPGLHLASRYLPQVIGKEMIDVLPSTFAPCIVNSHDCLGMFIFDLWAQHCDVRQALFLEIASGLQAYFIDHGELFGGPHWYPAQFRLDMRPTRRAVLYIEGMQRQAQNWIVHMRDCIPAAMRLAIEQLPSCWLCSNPVELSNRFIPDLDKLQGRVNLAINALEHHIQLAPAFANDEPRKRLLGTLQPNGDKESYYLQ